MYEKVCCHALGVNYPHMRNAVIDLRAKGHEIVSTDAEIGVMIFPGHTNDKHPPKVELGEWLWEISATVYDIR